MVAKEAGQEEVAVDVHHHDDGNHQLVDRHDLEQTNTGPHRSCAVPTFLSFPLS